MFCRSCGKELPENAQFCPYCGASAAPESGAQQSAAQNGAGYGAQYDPQYGPSYGAQYGPPYGGQPQYGVPPRPYPNPQDVYSGGWIALGFFFPLVGLILYLVWQTEYPNRSRACGKGALIGVIVNFALVVVLLILSAVLVALAASAAPYYVSPAALF